MNKKIYELSKQAGFGPKFDPAEPGEPSNLLSLLVEDFGKLIIEECVVCAQREIIRSGPDTPHNQAIYKVIDSIKERFKIE